MSPALEHQEMAQKEEERDASVTAPHGITSDSDSEARAARDQADKRIRTAIARGALKGYAIHIVGDGSGGSHFQVTRWNLARSLEDIEAVERFLERVGAA